MSNSLLIRADADRRIGSGHVMRCLALAQAWQLAGGHVVFLSHCESDSVRKRITNAGIELIPLAYRHPDPRDLQTTLDILQARPVNGSEHLISQTAAATWLILDGYHFDPGYQQAIRAEACRLLVIDDMAHLRSYHGDILLNQNLGAEKLIYDCDQDTTLLLGSRYVLLRQEFLSWHGWRREVPALARKVLVTMGGGDPDNVTLKVIHSLEQVQVDGMEVVVVVGGSNPHYETLQAAIRNLRPKIRLECGDPRMPELMAWADVAVTGGGSTCWELLFMGLPSLALILAENQHAVVRNLDAAGLSVSLGWHEEASPMSIAYRLSQLISSAESREKMARNGPAMIGDLGTSLVVNEMLVQPLKLRAVVESDCELLWKWANDPEARASAFCSEYIPGEVHDQWFRGKLEDPGCIQFIGLIDDNIPIGQVRFDVRGDEAEVDVSVAPNHRRKGYGIGLIRKGVQALQREATVKAIHAFVKLENRVSLQAFLGAGFIDRGVEAVKGQSAVRLTWRRDE